MARDDADGEEEDLDPDAPDDPDLDEETEAGRDLVENRRWWEAISAGKTDAEIAAEFDVEVDEAREARDRVLQAEARSLLVGVNDMYASFRVRMEGILRRMDHIHRAAMNPPARANGTPGRPNLKVALDAATAMARVIDRTVERGQELGVLPKAAFQRNTKVTVSGGVMVGAMTTEELARGIQGFGQERTRLRAEYGAGSPFASMPVPDVYEADQSGPVVSDREPSPAPRPARRKA